MPTQRLNVDIDADLHHDFHVFAVSQRLSMSDLVRRFVSDEPTVERLRQMVSSLPQDARLKDLSIKPDEVSPRPTGGWVWEYRLPSGRRAKVVKTDSGIFLTH